MLVDYCNKGQDGSDLVKVEIYFFLTEGSSMGSEALVLLPGTKDLSIFLLCPPQNGPLPRGPGSLSQLWPSHPAGPYDRKERTDPCFSVAQTGSCSSCFFSPSTLEPCQRVVPSYKRV